MPTTYVKQRTAGVETNQKLVADISDEILYVHTMNAPFTYFSTLGGKREVTQYEYSWFDDELQPRQTAVNLAAGYAAGATSIVVDNGPYASPGDLVWVPRTMEVFRVTSNSTHTWTVVRGGTFGTTAAALLDNDVLVILGNCNPEYGKDPEAKSTLEVKYTGYTQTIKNPVAASDRSMKAKHYGGSDWKYQLAKLADKHSQDIEYATLFNGTPTNYTETLSALYTTSGDKTTLMGGFCGWYMPTYGTSSLTSPNSSFINVWTEEELTQAEFEIILEHAFLYGGMGKTSSRRKLFLMGPRMVTGFERWMKSDLRYSTSDTTGGLKFLNWDSAHGSLKAIPHNALKAQDSSCYTWGLIVDPKYIKYVYHTGRDTKVLTERQNANVDGRSDMYMTDFGMEFRLAPMHTVIKLKDVV